MKKVIDKAESRGRALYDWLDSHHTFSFDTYYNPRRMNFGALRVLNDDRVDQVKASAPTRIKTWKLSPSP